MNYPLRFETRGRVRTISVPVNWTMTDVDSGAQRLRSWAMISGVPISGRPFATLDSPMTGTVHLPIGAEEMPHPQTGLRLDAVNATPYVSAGSVRFAEARAVVRALRDAYETHGVRAEFHVTGRDFLSGEVHLPVLKLPESRDAFVALPGAEPASAPAEAVAAASVLPAPRTPVSVITVAFQPASGGDRVARAVARMLGIRVADQDIVEHAARAAGVDVRTVEAASQHRGFFQRLLENMAAVHPSMDPFMGPALARYQGTFRTQREMRDYIESAIRATAENGNVVILGQGAQLALGPRPDTFRVLVTASEGARVAELIADGATADEARASIARQDDERRGYFRDMYGVEWLDANHYDLVISADTYDADTAAEIVCHAAGVRTRQPARGVAVPEQRVSPRVTLLEGRQAAN